MPYVSEELIEKMWRRVGSMSGQQILRLQKAHKKAQSPMTIFMAHYFLAYREDAAGVGIYVYHVVLEAFSTLVPRPRRIKNSQLEEAVRFRMASSKKTTAQDVIKTSAEPHVMNYIYDALNESDDVVLSLDERDNFLAVLAAVVDCLHEACRRT